MAFPTGWNRKCPLTIQGTNLPGNLSSFPVVLTAAQLPSEMVTSGGSNAALSNGADIRFSSDSAGATPLHYEIVDFTQNSNPSNATAEIWVLIPSLTASTNQTIYVWYKNSGASAPSASDGVYGSQGVWTNYALVLHMGNPSGISVADSTSYAQTVTNSSVTGSAGRFGECGYFNGSAYLSVANVASLQFSGAMSASMWIEYTNANLINFLIGQWYPNSSWELRYNSNYPNIIFNGGGVNTNAGSISPQNTWHLVNLTYDGTNVNCYVDGSVVVGPTSTAIYGACKSPVYIGSNGPNLNNQCTGYIDEIRIATGNLTSNWINTEYNNQYSASSFWSVGGQVGPQNYQPVPIGDTQN